MRGLTAALRNWPRIFTLLGEKYEDAVKSCNNTTAKELWSMLGQMSDMHNIIFMIGITQILDIYSVASLASQQSQWFPTQVWNKIHFAKEKNLTTGAEMEMGRTGT